MAASRTRAGKTNQATFGYFLFRDSRKRDATKYQGVVSHASCVASLDAARVKSLAGTVIWRGSFRFSAEDIRPIDRHEGDGHASRHCDRVAAAIFGYHFGILKRRSVKSNCGKMPWYSFNYKQTTPFPCER
jgi:hypothetical protein